MHFQYINHTIFYNLFTDLFHFTFFNGKFYIIDNKIIKCFKSITIDKFIEVVKIHIIDHFYN